MSPWNRWRPLLKNHNQVQCTEKVTVWCPAEISANIATKSQELLQKMGRKTVKVRGTRSLL